MAWCPLLGGGQEPRCSASPPWSKSQPPAAGFCRAKAQDRSLSLDGGEIPRPHHGSTQHTAGSARGFSTPSGRFVPSPATPSPDARGRRATAAGADGAATRVWHTLRAHAGPWPSTRHPHACHGATGSCPAPCQPRGDGTKSAIPREAGASRPSQPLHSPNPKGKWAGRAGSSGWRRWKRWPKPQKCFDLSPISRARSAPSLRAQLGSFLITTTLEQPSECGNSPEAVQNKVKFRCFSPPGTAWERQSRRALQQPPLTQHPKKCLLPAPQFLHPVRREMVPTHKQTWRFTHGNELRNSRSAQVQLWSPKSNSSAGEKGSRAGAGAQNSSHKGELSSHRQRKAVSSPLPEVC